MSAHRTRGYHRLAAMAGPYPEVAIFRRFGELNTLNLLSLQAELISMQATFKAICKRDDVDNEKFATSFYQLNQSAGNANDDQYQMLMRIREKLREYNSTLLEMADLARLSRPSQPNLKFLREWLWADKQGEGFLQSAEAYTWDAPSESEQDLLDNDLVALQDDPNEEDPFSYWLSSTLLDWYHKVFGSRRNQGIAHKIIDEESGIVQYSNSALLRFNTILVTVVSSAIPVLAIVTLYFVQNTLDRIGVLVAFTIAFALALALFTNATRLEIFATTSGFVAIEIIFIGSPSSH